MMLRLTFVLGKNNKQNGGRMAKWYSEEMKEFHMSNVTNEYFVYHWFYTGMTRGWVPSELKWGYIGLAPYSTIPERYRIETLECKRGDRKRMRTVIKMLDQFQKQGKIGFRIIAEGLTRKDALYLEKALRPENWTHSVDRRVWNEVAGG